MRARSPGERVAAARAREEAVINRGESDAVRQNRIMEAETRARLEAEHQLSEAQRERLDRYKRVFVSRSSNSP